MRSSRSAHTPGGEGEHDEREELGRGDERDVSDAAAGGEDRERERHRGDPVAQAREHLAAEEQAKLSLVPQYRRQLDASDVREHRDRMTA